MKLADDQGNTYKAHFYHSSMNNLGVRLWPRTECRLHLDPCVLTTALCTAQPAGVGIAVCSRRDEFRKATGRKIALSRAMLDLGIERATRAKLWEDYLEQVRLG